MAKDLPSSPPTACAPSPDKPIRRHPPQPTLQSNDDWRTHRLPTLPLQLTPPMGCDAVQIWGGFRASCFNSRTRMGCDVSGSVTGSPVAVSIHAPAWGATENRTLTSRTCMVSIHAPAWGATVMPGDSFKVKTVSIHAPAWGATVRGGVTSFHNWFQFTHPHGVRQEPHCPRAWLPRFNSRTRMGCDQTRRLSKITLRVSIHAPAWGATAIIVTI